MTEVDILNFVSFKPLAIYNPIAMRRRKLIAKLNEQIQITSNEDYTLTQNKSVTDAEGSQRKVELTKRVKRWCAVSFDAKIILVMIYGHKLLEFAKGKNVIELAS